VEDPVQEGVRTLSLDRVVREAMDVNPELAAKDRMVAAGAENVKDARSILLPQVEIGATGSIIDEDRAKLGFGAYPERSLAGTASLTQVLWSEQARTNLSIQKSLQAGRVGEFEQARLDIALEAASAYLNVLRAGTLERIRKNDLDAARSHLELARVRQTVGTSGPSEVYRWEAQIALARKAVLDAGAKRSLAEMALNRVLRRPLEEKFHTAETSLDDPELLSAGGKLRPWLNDPWNLEIFRNFLVSEGMKASPEIQRLDAAISAQERVLRSAGYAFYSPTVAFQGQVSQYMLKDGAGVGSIADKLPAQLAMLKGLFPKLDDTSWSLGVRVSFPLSRGGAKYAEYDKARADLARLEHEREAASAKIEQRIRSTLRMTGTSYAGIRLSRDAAEAAHKNLELVRDAYSRGVVSIMELIDAQNASLLTDEGASNADFDFLLDLMNTERAAGRFDFFRSAQERESFFQRLSAFGGK
jgi:outer membrane protein